MNVLGIETSCDENSVAVVKDGQSILSNVVYSQVDLHKIYGGVVPEVAARSHIEVMIPTINEALDRAKLDWSKIDAIAVANGPGLGGSLLIGTLTAKTLARVFDKPLYGVHHALGHIYANFIKPDSVGAKSSENTWSEPKFPILALIVSGGHSHLVLMHNHAEYELLGQTQDDAVGEAFDKVAKIIGLPYPGGPSIEISAKNGNPNAFKLPIAKMSGYDYSFSGLKTAVLRAVQELVGVGYDYPSSELKNKLTDAQVNDISASFQYFAVKALVDTTLKAYKNFNPQTVVIAGGVAANTKLRKQLKDALPININYAPISLCTDNGAMIAALGYYKARFGKKSNPLTLDTNPSLAL